MSSTSDEKLRRIGILTGGGDCPGLNAVIRGVCAGARREGFEVTGLADGFQGLLEGRTTDLHWDKVHGLLHIGGTVLGTSNKGSFAVPLDKEVAEKTIAEARKLGLEAVVAIGGDGTMAIAHAVSEYGLPVVGVPKTIDNDLASTDRTFGFDSAVAVVSEALDRLHTTASSHHRVMVVEVMGRNAGWIALGGAMAGGADVCILPEVEWKWEPIFARLRDASKGQRGYSIVVVSEGAKAPGRTEQIKQASGNLGGIGHLVSETIAKETGLETRLTVLGHTQRGGSPTATDRILSTRFGVHAAHLVAKGEFQRLVALRGTDIVSVPLTADLGKQKLIDVESDQLLWAARQVGIIFGDEE